MVEGKRVKGITHNYAVCKKQVDIPYSVECKPRGRRSKGREAIPSPLPLEVKGEKARKKRVSCMRKKS